MVEHVKLMFDLQILAIQADLTRVWTFLYGREATSMTFPHLDISMGHHEISHHNFEKHKLDALAKINVDQSQLFAYFLAKLDAMREADSTLLDHSLILYGSNLSVPTSHSQHDLPIIVAGGAAGRIAGGRYLTVPGRHNAADEPLSHDAGQGRRANRKARRQHGKAEPPGGLGACASCVRIPALVPRLPAFGVAISAEDRLFDAARSDDQSAVARLIQDGADVNAREDDGATALAWAACA